MILSSFYQIKMEERLWVERNDHHSWPAGYAFPVQTRRLRSPFRCKGMLLIHLQSEWDNLAFLFKSSMPDLFTDICDLTTLCKRRDYTQVLQVSKCKQRTKNRDRQRKWQDENELNLSKTSHLLIKSTSWRIKSAIRFSVYAVTFVLHMLA